VTIRAYTASSVVTISSSNSWMVWYS